MKPPEKPKVPAATKSPGTSTTGELQTDKDDVRAQIDAALEKHSTTENGTIYMVRDFGALEDGTIVSITDLERECFGYEGFGEYLVCSDPECRRLQSVDEVYDVDDSTEKYVPLSELEIKGPKIPACPCCEGETELLIPRAEMANYLKWYYQRAVFGALLLDSEGNVQGETLAYHYTRLGDAFDDMNYRKGYEADDYFAEMDELLARDARNAEVVVWNRIAISKLFRGFGNFNGLIKACLDQHPEYDDLPLIGDTKFGSNLWPLLRAIGFEDVLTDDKRGVAVMLGRYGTLREIAGLSQGEFKAKYGERLQHFRAEQKRIMATAEYKKPVHFRGAALLPPAEQPIEKGLIGMNIEVRPEDLEAEAKKK